MAASAPPASGRIFISYRREETAFPAGWLYDRLTDRFGGGQVFKDVDSIQLGDDFVEVITRAVASCDVLLVVIGSEWLTITDEHGRRRLDNPDDFVRLEIEAALTRKVRVIPILVNEARMPRTDELPDTLAGLVRRQALELSPSRFDFDTSRLLRVLDGTLAEVRTTQHPGASEATGQGHTPGIPPAASAPPGGARPPSDQGKPPDRLRRRRFTQAWILAGAGAGAVLLTFLIIAVVTDSDTTSDTTRTNNTVPRSLEDVAANFGPAIDPPGHFTLDTLETRYSRADIARLRPLLRSLGFRRGFGRTAKSSNGELMGLSIMEFESPAAAKRAEPQIGACYQSPQGNFDIPSVPGATGRRCHDASGRPVQEATFTRGPLFFKVKLERVRQPESTAKIMEMARSQAEKAG